MLLLSSLLLFLVSVLSQSVEESPTGALLSFPYVTEDSPLYGLKWEVAPSQFGFHDYGGTLEGMIVLPKNTSYHTECKAEPQDSNEYIHWVNDWNAESEDKNSIMLIDRGDCYFVKKIENAQSYGVSGAIVIDYKVENLFTMWPPEDFEDDINIPSVLLDEQDGEILMAALGVKNWAPKSIEQSSYPSVDKMNWTIARLEWGLPHEDDRVEYSLWTSANDPDSVTFKQNFKWTAIDLDSRNKTVFTPHFYLLNGSHWNCDTSALRCGRQCTNSGRYCSVDPEYDLSIGLDGMDVVQENLRQMCLWLYADLDEHNDTLWWDYSILWDENCFETDDVVSTFTETCSYEQMDKLDPTYNLKLAVQACISDSGGYAYKSGENTLLEDETKYREKLGIYALPTVTVNEFMVHGNIDCNEVTVEHCQVLDAICAGYVNGTQPPECYFTPAPTPVTCDDTLKDCLGVCYGSATIDCNGGCDTGYEEDYCGTCLHPNDPEWNSCVGCDGVVYSNKTYDCDNVCGGSHELNICGFCLDPDDQDKDFDTYGQDCQGTCNGEYFNDECGQCLPYADPDFNSCLGCDSVANSNVTFDCDGVCGGPKEFNTCGECIDTSEPDFDTRGMDCENVCGGEKEEDACGFCRLASDPAFDSCEGCDGIPYSNKTLDCEGTCGGTYQTNPCGYCMNPEAADFWTRGTDCRGVCGNAYETDQCGSCKALNDPTFNDCVGCDGVVDSGATVDCAMQCGGTSEINPCGFCLDPSTVDNFETFGIDCEGVCNGQKTKDSCGQCLYASDAKFDSCVGCDGKIDSGLVNDCANNCDGDYKYNACGMCVDSTQKHWNESSYDCRGVCNGGYEYNNCGHCVAPTNTTAWNCGSSVNDGGNNGSSKISHMTVGIVAIIAAIVILIVCIVVFFIYRRQQQVDQRFGNLIKQYEIMDDNDNVINTGGVKKPKRVSTKVNKGRVQVPDEEEDDGL